MKTFKELKKLPLQKRTIAEEYRLARREKRQPNCVFCGKPLQIEQALDVYVHWVWDKATKTYLKKEDIGNGYKPLCTVCGKENWGFIDDLALN